MLRGIIKRIIGNRIVSPFGAMGTVQQQADENAAPKGKVGFGGMRSGHLYEVIREFSDYDDFNHSIGERWFFVHSDYLPYEDRHTIFIEDEDGRPGLFLLQGYSEQQMGVIHNWHRHVREVFENEG